MELIKLLLFNLSLLLVILFFVQISLERLHINQISKKGLLLYFIVSLFICMFFSVTVMEGVRVDLRQVVLILGGLYFGFAPILALVMILIRSFLGFDIGLWVSIGIYGMMVIAIHLIRPWFIKQAFSRKLFVLMGFTTLTTLAFFIIYQVLHVSILRADILFGMIVIPALSIGVIAYAFESIKQNMLLREQIVKSQKLEAIGHTGAAISHEIRNPIAKAKHMNQTLLAEKKLPPEITEQLKVSILELEKAEKIIHGFLAYAIPTLNHVEEMDIHRELNHVLQMVEPMAKLQKVVIETDFGPIGMIQGDKKSFSQCFLNIIKNGIESMPSGGILQVKTNHTDKYINIIISDTGKGFSKEEINRLGEPYYSINEDKGMGFGMMVAYSIVKALKGTIKVNSEIDKGSTYSVSIPQYLIQSSTTHSNNRQLGISSN
ncbi:ATP-binding protein [Bacillus sp. 31A1R]|uniref:histidine kinase n=1 Tax=Robertmurraya mangrovi TaxID=3098077 RepID=A0ABU5IZP8_9BACI|nr:ATP-binding protein [Bacillus sp. 31A1R]MDZ5472592.1 ATP-binding protein [Bacillus sp. 31A1R]